MFPGDGEFLECVRLQVGREVEIKGQLPDLPLGFDLPKTCGTDINPLAQDNPGGLRRQAAQVQCSPDKDLRIDQEAAHQPDVSSSS